MPNPKITVRLTRDTWKTFNSLMKRLGFRRDSYLNRVLPAEVCELSKEKGCDDAGAAHLVDLFRGSRSRRVQVSLRLEESLINQLNAVCDKKRVVRDLFLDQALQFVLARITPAAMVILAPRLRDGDHFEAVERVHEEWVDAVDYGALLIYNAKKVAEERKFDEDFERFVHTKIRAKQLQISTNAKNTR